MLYKGIDLETSIVNQIDNLFEKALVIVKKNNINHINLPEKASISEIYVAWKLVTQTIIDLLQYSNKRGLPDMTIIEALMVALFQRMLENKEGMK